MSGTLWKLLRPDWTSLEEVLPEGSGKALDIGAGNGRHRRIIEDAGYRWTGCDTAATRGDGVIEADAHHLPFDDNTFDLAVIWQVMEYLRDPWKAVEEISRVLTPGGILIGSASFLEPMHGRVYFNFSQYGLEEILKNSGFGEILLWPGIGCFPLISWTWVRQLTGSDTLARSALWGARVGVWGMSLVVRSLSSVRRLLRLGGGSKNRWLRETAPYHFAGQITFRATKRIGV